MKLESVGILIGLRPFGERDAIAYIFTRDFGVLTGMLRGATVAKKNKPLVGQCGNVSWNARLDSQLGTFHFESLRNLAAPIMSDMCALSCMNSAFALIQKLLPEREKYENLYDETVGLLEGLMIVGTPPLRRGRNAICVSGEGMTNHRSQNEKIKQFATNMRNNMTVYEKKFWYAVNEKKLGFQFRRQFNIDNKYIADFVCLEKKLIIEIDGAQHIENKKDKIRTEYLKKYGFDIVRFWNWDIKNDLKGCLEIVYDILTNNSFEKRLAEFNKNLSNITLDVRGNVVLPAPETPSAFRPLRKGGVDPRLFFQDNLSSRINPALEGGSAAVPSGAGEGAVQDLYLSWEIALLREMGYALDLTRCSGCGCSENLNYLSPKTGRAVCDKCAAPYIGRLYELPITLDVTHKFLKNICEQMNVKFPTGLRVGARIF